MATSTGLHLYRRTSDPQEQWKTVGGFTNPPVECSARNEVEHGLIPDPTGGVFSKE